MRIYYQNKALFLAEGADTIVCEPCECLASMRYATAMIMANLRALRVRSVTIENVCIWMVTDRLDLEAILLPQFTYTKEGMQYVYEVI